MKKVLLFVLTLIFSSTLFAETIIVREGEALPSAPAGYEWKPTGGVYESFPPQYEYVLVKKQTQEGDTIIVREGESLPSAPAGYKWKPTGKIYESFPPQYEYVLVRI